MWLLRELTTKFSNLWVKVSDSDGEFLLIEASATLPRWLEPEVAENRVWINNGQIKIIKPADSSNSKHTEEKVSLAEAHEIIVLANSRMLHSQSLEDEAFFRLRNYPAQIEQNMHHAIVRIPRKVAYLLLEKAAYVALAVESFYLRDPVSLTAVRSSNVRQLIFPPEDLINMSVTFPRPAYAQLRSQEFPVHDAWQLEVLQATDDTDRARVETGMKLTLGFEILLRDKQYQDRPAVREMKLLISDLDSGDAKLPVDADLLQLGHVQDDEQWMNVSLDDLQSQLRGANAAATGKSREQGAFGDTATEQNLQRIVKQFEVYLNDDKGGDNSDFYEEDDDDKLDDIDSDEIEEDLKNAGFDDDDFTKLMQEMMGMPEEVLKELMHGDIDALKKDDEPNPDAHLEAANEHENELRSEDDEDVDDTDLRQLVQRMQLGSRNPNNGSSSHGLSVYNNPEIPTDSSDEEGPLDPRKEEVAKQLLESLQAHGGASGPAANLMELMARQYAEEDKRKLERKAAEKP